MKYHIWTEGCQMNVADSRRLSSALQKLGLKPSPTAEAADVIVLNTCVVRQSAEDKAIGRLSSLRPLKEKNPDLIINLMGCLVGVQGNPAMQQRFPWVDVFSAPSDPNPLLAYLNTRLEKVNSQEWRQKMDAILDEEFTLPPVEHSANVSENLPIVLGCSHACSYCVIPHKRGRERSRAFDQILLEAQGLADRGAREIVLLGQIVDRYGLDIPGSPLLHDLLRSLSQYEPIKRIRFLTSHPNWMSDALIRSVAEHPKVMPHIEVPIQAGDDEILTAMRRGYSAESYRKLVEKLRKTIPGVSIATDIIVGFPGESDAAFMNTYQLLEDLRLDVAHLARYSPRSNTYSAKFLQDDVPAEEKKHRFRLLEDLQTNIVTEINQAYLNQSVPVLFEAKAKNRWRGRTPTNRLVFVESDEALLGQERDVHITWTGPWSLIGELS